MFTDNNIHIITANKNFGKTVYDAFCDAVDTLKADTPDRPLNIVFPTGGTPKSFYKELRENPPRDDFRVFGLDEYVAEDTVLTPDDLRSYQREIREEIITPLSLDDALCHFFNNVGTPEEACAQMDESIKDHGGLDLVLLGIGSNGHIGFNEPGSLHASKTRTVLLTDETKEANALYCNHYGGVPEQAVTLGIQTILRARKILLLATANKANIVRKAVKEYVPSNEVPASFLRTHDDCTLIAPPAVTAGLR